MKLTLPNRPPLEPPSQAKRSEAMSLIPKGINQ